MSAYLIEQIATKANIRVETRSEVVAVHGDERLDAIDVVDRRTGTTSRRDTRVFFVLIGAEAATDWLRSEIACDEHGFVLTGTEVMEAGQWTAERDPLGLEKSAQGIFAIGDIRSGSVKRVAASVGEGGVAIALMHPLPATRHASMTAQWVTAGRCDDRGVINGLGSPPRGASSRPAIPCSAAIPVPTLKGQARDVSACKRRSMVSDAALNERLAGRMTRGGCVLVPANSFPTWG